MAREPQEVTTMTVTRIGPGTSAIEPDWYRRVLGQYPTGVCVVAADEPGAGPCGMVVGSFTSVSLDPPLVSVCVAHSSTTWPLLSGSARLGVSVLSAQQELACRQLAARDGDRFASLDWRATEDGAVLVEQASAWLDCSVEQLIRAGDHDIVLLRVHELDADPSVPPLVFHASGFRRLEAA